MIESNGYDPRMRNCPHGLMKCITRNQCGDKTCKKRNSSGQRLTELNQA